MDDEGKSEIISQPHGPLLYMKNSPGFRHHFSDSASHGCK